MNELGELRPSQLIYTFGVGAIMDLPNMSALILGLDDWDLLQCQEIIEERLLAAVQQRMGPQVRQLMLPPVTYDDDNDPTAPAKGVPVAPFPRWLRCPFCSLLGTIDSGHFKLIQDPYRPDRTRYVHHSCQAQRPPTALPVRFLLACREGHLSDFPWVEFVHKQTKPCTGPRLSIREFGVAGDASDIVVKCETCGTKRPMSDAFDTDEFKIQCRGHHPHLRMNDPNGCRETAKTILLGASNSWFPMVMSALTIPRAADKLGQLVEKHWVKLKDLPSLEVAKWALLPQNSPAFIGIPVEQVWAAIQAKLAGVAPGAAEPSDLKIPEWELLANTLPLPATDEFRARRVAAPLGYGHLFGATTLVETVREVRALIAFTRLESRGDFAEVDHHDDDRQTPLSRQSPKWLPASEVRGEGIFVRFNEDALQAWEAKPEVKRLEADFFQAHKVWRTMRNVNPPGEHFPGMRFVLIHSLSHALMRQIALECGYTAASIRERIYCLQPGEDHGPMAGILLYTAASDSEGTLGGLVQLGDPTSLGRQIHQALEALKICGSDPLCSEHPPTGDGRGIHGASCHACLFAPETSCEKGNRYLDRNALFETFASKTVAYFHES
ncbi:MAG: DUF1998 domain-containing protein [Verrucomicrobia bacterium]|nr:DUF1998 domain-containing protein [Verrucomicrobiota bacterium]